MPQIRFHMLKRKEVRRFIGKAKINGFTFYLIKWKAHLEREISWQHTSVMANMGKLMKAFNDSIKGQIMPYVDVQYKERGLKLLELVDEKKQREKCMWKIQNIIGKQLLNGYVYYFMKWKHISILESDWIAQHGLWRLYPEQLKQIKASIKNQALPYLDRDKLLHFIQTQRKGFELDQQSIIDIYEKSIKTKIEKLQPKGVKKQEIKLKKEFTSEQKEQILQEMINQLKNRFFNPVEELYLKEQAPFVKNEKLEYDEAHEQETGDMAQLKDLKEESQVQCDFVANKRQKGQKKYKKRLKDKEKKIDVSLSYSQILSTSCQEAIGRLSQYLIKVQPQQVCQKKEGKHQVFDSHSIADSMDKKSDSKDMIGPRLKQTQSPLQISSSSKELVKNEMIKKQPVSRQFSRQQSSKPPKNSVQISLFAQKIAKIISTANKNEEPQTQNLYRVIVTNSNKYIDVSQDDTLNESSQVQQSEHYYQTSVLAQNYPRELIQYLETQNSKLRQMLKQDN